MSYRYSTYVPWLSLLKIGFVLFIIRLSQDYKQIMSFASKLLKTVWNTPAYQIEAKKKVVVVVRMGKIGISVIATTGYNDEILSSLDHRYKRFLLYLVYEHYYELLLSYVAVLPRYLWVIKWPSHKKLEAVGHCILMKIRSSKRCSFWGLITSLALDLHSRVGQAFFRSAALETLLIAGFS